MVEAAALKPRPKRYLDSVYIHSPGRPEHFDDYQTARQCQRRILRCRRFLEAGRHREDNWFRRIEDAWQRTG